MLKVSLKKKIMFVVVLAIVLSGFLATLSVFIYTKNVLVDREKTVILIKTMQIEREVADVFHQKGELVGKIAGSDDIKNGFDSQGFVAESISMHLGYYNLNGEYSQISIVGNDGSVLASTEHGIIGKSYADKGFFKKTVIEDEMCVAAAVDNFDGKLGYFITHSIKNNEGGIIGAVIMRLDPEIFGKVLTDSDAEDAKLNTMLVNNHGIIVFSEKQGRLLKSLGVMGDSLKSNFLESNHFPGLGIESIQYQIVQEMINRNVSESQILEFSDDVDGEEEILAVKKVGEYPLFVIVETDKEDHYGDAVQIALFLSTLVGLSALAAGIIIYVSINYQLSPLDKLHGLVLAAAKGNYFVRMKEVEGAKEISELANAFNVMIKSVKKSRDEINRKVDEQTKDINKKKDELENQKVAILNILEDVRSEKEKTEFLAKDLEKFKLAVENASDHIVITDADGAVLYANKAVEKITGFSNKEVIGKKAGSKELWGGNMKKEVYDEFWDIIKNKKQIYAGEFKNKRKNGEEYDAAASVSPILDNSGQVVFFIGIERDITREKEIDKAKTEFVSLASHQLRTPLTAINWYVEMLMNGDAGKINKEQKNYLEEVYKGSKRMVDLVNALLNVSRIDLGTFAIDPEPIDFAAASKDVLNELKPSIINKKMKIKEVYDKNVPLINADPKLIRIIFQNLLSNAVKYTPEKGTISVGIKKDNEDVLITISDTGYGIPIGQQARIFEKLFRADNARQRETDGTGLGLYVLKSIIEKNDGKIWFESAENKGTTFYVRMPLSGMKKKEGSKGLSAT